MRGFQVCLLVLASAVMTTIITLVKGGICGCLFWFWHLLSSGLLGSYRKLRNLSHIYDLDLAQSSCHYETLKSLPIR